MLAQKKVVVVGGGPAGMEAARVCAMRGHRVVLFEAAGELGGQIKIASRVLWRKDLEGISDWLSEEIDRLGVTIRCNTYADEQSILLEEPDVVVVATGGIPEIPLPSAAHKCVTVWDILTGSTQPADEIIVFDGTGQIQAASCADMLASRGCSVEFISADVSFGVDIPYPTRVLQQKRLYQKGVRFLFEHDLVDIQGSPESYVATFRNVLTDELVTRGAAQVVVEFGTMPSDELFNLLRRRSRNQGCLDQEALLQGVPQTLVKNPEGRFDLFRVGDAIESRDIHAALLDSLRLCMSL